MFVKYAGAWFQGRLTDAVFRPMLKPAARNVLRSVAGRPARYADYLNLCLQTLRGKGSGTVVDVGCNLGSTSIPVARLNPGIRVVGIDAHPTALAKTLRNLALNRFPPNFNLLAAAVSPAPGPVRLYTCPTNAGGHRVTGFADRPEAGLPSATLYVPTISLASVIRVFGIQRCDMLKIDVEGYELDVLESAGDALEPERFPAVVAEYGPEGYAAAGRTGTDLLRLMRERGYECTDLHSGQPIREGADLPDVPITDLYFRALARHRTQEV